MQMSRGVVRIARSIFIWSTLVLVLQGFSFVFGAEYDSRSAWLAGLWWFTQILSFPIWCPSEAATLIGVNMGGSVAYAIITSFIIFVSFRIISKKNPKYKERPGGGVAM